MGTASYCDRCKEIGVQLVPVLGVDLCNACIAEFPAWVSAGRKNKVSRIVQRGQWPVKLERLAQSRGVITPDDVAHTFGVSRKQAHWQLNYHVRMGVIVRLSQARYAAAVRAEAAE